MVDLESSPGAPVDLVLPGHLVAFDACLEGLPPPRDAVDKLVIGYAVFGLLIPPEITNTARGAEKLVEITLKDAAGTVRWAGGDAVGTVAGLSPSEPENPYLIADTALSRMGARAALKASRAAMGRSPFGLLATDDPRARVAVVAGFGEDEASVRLMVRPTLANLIAPGYPAVVPADRLRGSRAPTRGFACVVGLFADEDDAIEWIRSLREDAESLGMVHLAR